MSQRLMRLLALFLALVMLAAACGGSDDSSDDAASGDDTSSASEEDAMDEEEDAMEEDSMEEDAMEEDSMDEMDDESHSAAYGSLEDCSADADGLNIGTLLPETGALAFLSDPLVQAVEMAICDINAAGGVNGALVTRSAGDSGTDPDIANQTVDRLLATENVDAIVGAAASGISGSVIDKITSAPVVQCSPSNTAAGLGVSGDNGFYFRTAPSDDLQAPALANLILNDGYSSVAFVPRADDWGIGLRTFFVPAFEAGGGEVVYSQQYAPESTSFDDVVGDVIASGPDAVVLASFEEGLQLMRTMIEQGVGPDTIPIYITDGMATGDLGSKVVEGTDIDPGIVQGVRGTQPSANPEAGASFFPEAFAAYAPDVETVFSSQAYDCAITIALAAHAAGSNDSAAIADAMVEVTRGGEKCSTFAECAALIDGGADIDYDGASGPIDYLDAGEPSVGAYDIYEYDADGLQQVQEQLVFESAGAAAPAPTAGGDTSVGLVYDIGGRGDLSFNDSAAEGLDRAENQLGIPFGEASPNNDGSNRGELLQLAADANDIVIGVGFLFRDDAAAVAAENADTNFAVIDDGMLDFGTGEPLGPNVAGLTFAEQEGSFLVGAAAALKSETGQIGFIGGVCCFGLIEKFEAGFRAGALAVNPDIDIVAEYITDAPDFDGFNQPDRAQVIATTMYEDGADVIYHAAGGAGNGMFQAAKDFSEDNGSKVWGIGVDSDQFNTIGAVDASLQEYVLTSMLKRVDVAVFEILRAQQSGDFVAGNVVYDLSVDGVGYSTSGGFVDDIAGELEAFKAAIIAGDIVVPIDPTEVGG